MLLPCSPTPAGPAHQANTMRRRGPRNVHGEGSCMAAFEAQSHGFGTGCLRFAGRVAPTPRKTRFRLLAKLFRTGLFTRRVPTKGFEVYPTSQPPFPSSRGARTSLILPLGRAKTKVQTMKQRRRLRSPPPAHHRPTGRKSSRGVLISRKICCRPLPRPVRPPTLTLEWSVSGVRAVPEGSVPGRCRGQSNVSRRPMAVVGICGVQG